MPLHDHASHAPFTVTDSGGETTLLIDQPREGGYGSTLVISKIMRAIPANMEMVS